MNATLSLPQARTELELAWEALEDALAHHEPLAASEAAWNWWLCLQRLRDAS